MESIQTKLQTQNNIWSKTLKTRADLETLQREMSFVSAKPINCWFGLCVFSLATSQAWDSNGFAQKKKEISGLQRLPRVVLMSCCFPACCAATLQWKNHTVTPKSPLCLPHSAARLKSKRLSTPAANTTTSPAPAARGWGKKRPREHCNHIYYLSSFAKCFDNLTNQNQPIKE